MLVHTIASIKL